MKKTTGQPANGIQSDSRMTVTLNRENMRNLLFAAKMLDVEPDRLLNEWLLLDMLRDMRDPQSGALRELAYATVFDGAERAAAFNRNLARFEKRRGINSAPMVLDVKKV